MSTETAADPSDLASHVARMPLVDHHVHGALAGEPRDAADFARHIAETDRAPAPGASWFDTQLGFAIRRWCAPLLGLPRHASPEDYLARRHDLGAVEVTRRLLRATGIDTYLVETGYRGGELLDPQEMAAASGARVAEVVRLETVAESVAGSVASASEFPAAFTEALHQRTGAAVGLKTIVAYRHGFDFDPTRPSTGEVTAAAGRWLAEIASTGQVRVSDPVLLRFLLWTGVDRGLPLQVHVGFGDPDLDLHRADPLLLTEFIRALEPRGVPVLLLHSYPFHRQAGYLARVFPHVYFDIGLGINYLGVRAEALVRESLELAPFGKQLFSTDAWGPAELHYLGSALWREGMTRVLRGWVDEGAWSLGDALRVVQMIGAGNARRVYSLGRAA